MITFHVPADLPRTRRLQRAIKRCWQMAWLFLVSPPAPARDVAPGRRAPFWDLHGSLTLALAAAEQGAWELVESELLHGGEIAMNDAACLNLLGLAAEVRGDWPRAKQMYGRSMRRDRGYLPAELNMRRYFEMFTFGRSTVPKCIGMIRSLPLNLKDRATARAAYDH